jgi:hypothetical protein
MKPITAFEKILLFAALMLGVQITFAQDNNQQSDEHKYRIYVVKDENGSKEVIDKTFGSKDELTAFVKENKLEMPEAGKDSPGQEEVIIKKTKGGKEKAGNEQGEKSEKKITIIEKEEGDGKNPSDFEIILHGLSANERANLTQQLINMNLGKVEIVHQGK